MSANTGVWLEDLTWPEAKAHFEAGMPVVIPIGAASKAHGPHLPLKTDALTARALAQKLIERLPVIAAPVVGFGFYPAFTSFAGSQHLSAATFKALISRASGQPAGPRRQPHRAAEHRRLDRKADRRSGRRRDRPAGPAHAWPGRGGRPTARRARGRPRRRARDLGHAGAGAPERAHGSPRASMVLSRRPAPPAIRRGRAPSRASASWRRGSTTWWPRSPAAGRD